MSEKQSFNSRSAEPKSRPVGGTEYSWCKSVPGGTGSTVLGLHLSKPPDLSLLQNALQKLQNSHPNLRSKLHFDVTTNYFSFITPPSSHLEINAYDLSSTSQIIHSDPTVSPFQLVIEHELNNNSWAHPETSEIANADVDVIFASVYTLSDNEWAVVLRIHTAACDRTGAISTLRELLGLMTEGGGVGEKELIKEDREISLAIEECVPAGKTNKPFWARGMDMLGYSLNSLRFANLDFRDTESSRLSQCVRLKMNSDETNMIISGCESRGIKLFGVLEAAGLIAARSSKDLPEGQWEKYSVATLTDCRSLLDPILTSHDVGFYHSAIINSHDINGSEKLWELAKRTYTAFANAKNNNKHFSDVADLNFLMCKAIDNPGLTPASAMRTSLISVFEDPVMDQSNSSHGDFGLDDYAGCASIHGVGPSIAIFDTIRDGQLDCICVYPSPLHSREQMQDLINDMKRILVAGCKHVENDA